MDPRGGRFAPAPFRGPSDRQDRGDLDPSVWLGIRDGGGDGQLVQLDRASGVEVTRTAVSLPLRMLELDCTLWVSDYLENRLLGFAA